MVRKKQKSKLFELFTVAQGREKAIREGKNLVFSKPNLLSIIIFPFRIPFILFRGFFFGYLFSKIDKIQKKIIADYSNFEEDNNV